MYLVVSLDNRKCHEAKEVAVLCWFGNEMIIEPSRGVSILY